MSSATPLPEVATPTATSAVLSVGSPTDPNSSKAHKRTYQACEPCRNRKVRCDLGSVDAPSDPPCQRCRREKKQCYFTETRRKRKAGEPSAPELRDFGPGHRQDGGDGATTGRGEQVDGGASYDGSSEPAMMSHGNQPIRQEVRVRGDGDEVRNAAAAALFQQPIHQPGDALRLLVDAASRTESFTAKQSGSAPNPARRDGQDERLQLQQEQEQQPQQQRNTAIDPAIMDQDSQPDILEVAMQTWSRLRYVRAGWFTPKEGMAYLEYFSKHLALLSPTPIPDFRNPATHIQLLNDEPMMTVTLLTIASRYKPLNGPGGGSRSSHIHAMLWRECQDMVTRMFWGQEHFGGSFGLASGFKADTGEPMKRGLRALGSVEALLLLSDWHPRAMHFPPAPGNDSILAPLQAEWEEANRVMQTRNPHQGWTEPAMRSDRMSWSLVGMAYNLAVELGVFDSMPEKGGFVPGYKTRAYDPERADRVGRLVHIYTSQTSGRLGYPNMLPSQDTDMDHEFFKMVLEPKEGDDGPEFIAEQMQRAWCELAAIMRRVNQDIFRSKQQTLELIQTGKYRDVVESFWPALKAWLNRINSIQLPRQTRTILMMEYEYARTYINSLALQAQLEQYADLTSTDPSAANSENEKALFSARLVEISRKNAPYIAEVVDSTRNLLKHVVDDLYPSGGLRHSPVRTNFRILSGAMFLLKTFALGSKENDIHTNMALLSDTVNAMRNAVVDDVHLALRIADLLNSLVATLSTKFVRVPINSRSGQAKRARPSLSSRPMGAANAKGGAGGESGEIVAKTEPNGDSASGNTSDFPFAAPLVNPNDPNVMIMPPPDYAFNFDAPGGGGIYGAVTSSPRSAANLPNGYPPNTFSPPSQMTAPASSVGGVSVPPPPPLSFTSSQAAAGGSQGQPFSPMSTSSGSGGYDWYAIDVNPLMQHNSSNNGGNGGNGNDNGNGNGNGGGGGGVGGNGQGGPGLLAGVQTGPASWGNVFGPELGEHLDFMGQLAEGQGFDDAIFGTAWVN